MIAVLVAMGGLFSVLAYAVSRRRREFGIRVALGAGKRDLARLVQRDGISVATVGLLVGSAGAWAVQRILAAFQYGVTLTDPLNWLVVAGVIFAATLLASWRPAARAGRVDPAELLRQE
jgi:putative ABC transport system permease protein